MKISEEILNNISSLSKIKIDEKIKSDLIKDLESILKMVEEMNKIDTSGIEPMSHPLELLFLAIFSSDFFASVNAFSFKDIKEFKTFS